jgi:hypothetical protein
MLVDVSVVRPAFSVALRAWWRGLASSHEPKMPPPG